METRASHFAVGLFVLTALAALAFTVVWLGHRDLSHHGKRYRIFFDHSISGLQPGAAVRLSGVPVGVVKRVIIDPADPAKVEVTVEVDPAAPVKIDTEARTEMQGVTGTSVIELEHGTEAAALLASPGTPAESAWPVIPAESSASGDLLEAIPKLIDKLNGMINRIDGIASDRNAHNFEDAMAHLDHLATVMDAASPGLAHTIDNADAITTGLRTRLPKLTGDADAAISDLRGTMKDVDGLVQDNRKPLKQFTSDGLYQVYGLIADLKTLTGSLQRVSTRLERNPREFLFGEQADGVQPR